MTKSTIGLTEPNVTPELIDALIDRALDAFWSVIGKHVPRARTGDLSPERDIRLAAAARDAVSEWVENNVPSPSSTNF